MIWPTIPKPDEMTHDSIKWAFNNYTLRYLVHCEYDDPITDLQNKLELYGMSVLYNFKKMYTASTAEYNPIENYDRTEDSETKNTGTDTIKNKGKTTNKEGGTDTNRINGTQTHENSGTDTSTVEYGTTDKTKYNTTVRHDKTGHDTRIDDLTVNLTRSGTDTHTTDGSVVTQTDGLEKKTENTTTTDDETSGGRDTDHKGVTTTDSVTGDNSTAWFDTKKSSQSGSDYTEYGKTTNKTVSASGSGSVETDGTVNQTNDTVITDEYGSSDITKNTGTVKQEYASGDMEVKTGYDEMSKTGTDTQSATLNSTATITTNNTNATEYGKTEDATNESEESKEYGSATQVVSHIHGNIGVTTNQQMINSEIELRSRYLADLWVIGFISRYTVV